MFFLFMTQNLQLIIIVYFISYQKLISLSQKPPINIILIRIFLFFIMILWKKENKKFLCFDNIKNELNWIFFKKKVLYWILHI